MCFHHIKVCISDTNFFNDLSVKFKITRSLFFVNEYLNPKLFHSEWIMTQEELDLVIASLWLFLEDTFSLVSYGICQHLIIM